VKERPVTHTKRAENEKKGDDLSKKKRKNGIKKHRGKD